MSSPAPLPFGRASISTTAPVYVIAEAGVNHNGDLSMAKRLIHAAKDAGADCVKFQTFRADEIVTAKAPKAAYQLQVTDPSESQLAMLKSLELPESAFAELKTECDRAGIFFLSTPYSFTDVDLLERIGVAAYKIASGQLTEIPFLEYVARTGKPMIISTGMGSLTDIQEAVTAIRNTGNSQIVVLQCTTNYPSLDEDCHLRAMKTIADATQTWVGYSDHTHGSLAMLTAAAMGARVLEKHFTLDATLPGPDHACSMEPKAFAAFVQDLRRLEKMLGSSQKSPTEAERRNAIGMKRSIVARVAIPAGVRIRQDQLIFKRPATGMSPKEWKNVIGKVARQPIPADTIVSPEMLQ